MRRRRRRRMKDTFFCRVSTSSHIREKGRMFAPTRKIHYFYHYTASLLSHAPHPGGQSFGVQDNPRDYVASNNCTACTSSSIPSTCKSRVVLRALDRKIMSRPGTVYRSCSLTVVLLSYPEQYRQPSVSKSTQQLHSGWSQLNSVIYRVNSSGVTLTALNLKRKNATKIGCFTVQYFNDINIVPYCIHHSSKREQRERKRENKKESLRALGT